MTMSRTDHAVAMALGRRNASYSVLGRAVAAQAINEAADRVWPSSSAKVVAGARAFRESLRETPE
jgi:hypothetical protein